MNTGKRGLPPFCSIKKEEESILNMTTQLDEKQISALRALHFWRRNLLVASKNQDIPEYQKSRIAIVHLFKYCDYLKVPFKVRAQLLCKTDQFCDFSDLLI